MYPGYNLGVWRSMEESRPYINNRSPRDDGWVGSRTLPAHNVPLCELIKTPTFQDTLICATNFLFKWTYDLLRLTVNSAPWGFCSAQLADCRQLQRPGTGSCWVNPCCSGWCQGQQGEELRDMGVERGGPQGGVGGGIGSEKGDFLHICRSLAGVL